MFSGKTFKELFISGEGEYDLSQDEPTWAALENSGNAVSEGPKATVKNYGRNVNEDYFYEERSTYNGLDGEKHVGRSYG